MEKCNTCDKDVNDDKIIKIECKAYNFKTKLCDSCNNKLLKVIERNHNNLPLFNK